MKAAIKTETGSIYILDYEAKHWIRVEEGGDKSSHPLRSVDGDFVNNPVPKMGERCTFIGSPITPGTLGRLISTSPVVAMELVYASTDEFTNQTFSPFSAILGNGRSTVGTA